MSTPSTSSHKSNNKEMMMMWASLGLNPETGTCVRHPSVRIRLGSQSHCHYATCRLCALDLLAQENRLKDGPHSTTYINGADTGRNETNQDEDDEEPGDEDILDDDDDDDESDLNKQQENDSQSKMMMTRIQQAIMRISQLHAMTLLEKDELILRLQRQVATQDERILVLQATVDKQQKTITQELKAIKSIAKKRAQVRRNSVETSETTSTPETPSEQPPKLPGRKPSQPWNSNIQSGLANDSGSSPSTASASSVPSLPHLPPNTSKFIKRPGPSLNNGPNSTPPTLPQRMKSVDTNTESVMDDPYRQNSLDTENAKIHASSAFSSLTSGAEATISDFTMQTQSFAASQVSHLLSSAVTIDTFTDLQKPPQRKLSARPDPTDINYMDTISRGNSYSTGLSSKTDEISINDKGDEHSLDDPFHIPGNDSPPPPPPPPLPQQQQQKQAQEIAFVPTKQEIAFIPLSSPTKDTPPSLRASKSIPVPSRQTVPFDGHATAPVGSFHQEIEFNATDTFAYHHQHPPRSTHARSIAQVRFDESQQLLLEASQALQTTGLPTPSSDKLRKSLTKKSMSSEQEQQYHHEFGRSASNPSIGTRPRTQSREIEFSVSPEKRPKAKSVLERHLEGGSRSSNLGESMHNKTEEQIIQEKIYGKAAVASAEDEANDEYDYFDSGSLDLPFTTNKGFLEYPKDGNLSPVSCLTTLSNVRDSNTNEEEEDMGPRKTLHNAGVAKRLPMEEGFDSDDEEGDGGDEDPPKSSQDLSSAAGKGDIKSNGNDNTNTTTSSKSNSSDGTSNNDRDTTSEDYSQKQDKQPIWNGRTPNKISDSLPSYEASQRSLRTGSRDPKSASPFSNSTKRTSKPVLRVDNDTVQDKYGDEGKYTGTIAIDSRLPHGYGQMKYDNERQYDGEWKGGRWHGYGRWVNPNGDCYEGTFDYDARHGRGIYTWKNGNVYRGEFYHDKRQGKGAFHFANGNIYEGDFNNGVFDGQGRYKFDGGSYEGEWQNGRYHGRGILIFTDGSSHTGEFLDGVAHGQGEEKGADGTIRKGIWEHGKPQAVP